MLRGFQLYVPRKNSGYASTRPIKRPGGPPRDARNAGRDPIKKWRRGTFDSEQATSKKSRRGSFDSEGHGTTSPSPPGRIGRPASTKNSAGAIARAIVKDPDAFAASAVGNQAATARAIGCSRSALHRAWLDVANFLYNGYSSHCKPANKRSREELLRRLRAGGFVSVSIAFYALSDPELCQVIADLDVPVRLLIDRGWTRSCKIAIKCIATLIDAGVEVHHRRHMMHYKLLTLMYPTELWSCAGSANMTKAAFTTNDDYLFETTGAASFEAQSLFDWIWNDSVLTDPAVDLVPKKGSPFGSEPTDGGEPETPDTEPLPEPETPDTEPLPEPETGSAVSPRKRSLEGPCGRATKKQSLEKRDHSRPCTVAGCEAKAETKEKLCSLHCKARDTLSDIRLLLRGHLLPQSRFDRAMELLKAGL